MRRNKILMICVLMITVLKIVVHGAKDVRASDPIVQTSNGKVRGRVLENPNNKTFYSFQGIPFAKPPIEDQRFEPPQKPNDWEGILDDRNANKICIQVSTVTDPNETEDCLYLHVYTPQLPKQAENKLLPVVVNIHGGGFVGGSASINGSGPHYLMDYDVVMVAIQYRLGFFGFVSTGDLVCPGNNGFKDQQLALRWVQENIRRFGGDPEKVTIFGQSAGAGCIGYQLLGSNAEGLFRGAIQNSGSSLGPWALQRNPRSIAFQVGTYLNPVLNETSNTSEELMDYFKTITIEQVKKACVDIFGEGMIPGIYTSISGFVFSGVIEPEHDGAFLTERAYGKFESGNFNVVPILMGFNSEETLFMQFDKHFMERMKYYDEHTEILVSPDMHIVDINTQKEVGKQIRKIYVDGLLQDNEGPSIKYFSDTMFCRGPIKQAELASRHTDVYLYEFAYSGKWGKMGPDPEPIPGAEKVAHGEEMAYIFRRAGDPDPSTASVEDRVTMQRMQTMWTNFVKYLNPTPEPLAVLDYTLWPKISSTDEMEYLLINNTLDVNYGPKKPMMDEFNRLYNTYAVPPLDTF